MKYGKLLLLANGLLLLAACASTTKIKDVKPLTTNAPLLQSPEEEKLLIRSKRTHEELVDKGLIVRHKGANEYIAKLAKRISPEFSHPKIKLNFYILKDASVNASALPNGNIYLNVGLIAKLQSEDQLSFVMAHEVAHVIERHGLKRNIDRKKSIASSHVANLLLMGTNVIYYATLNDLASFSRETEDEADFEGMKLLAQSGLNIHEGMEAIIRLKQVKHAKEGSSAWSSHDTIANRSNTYQQRIEANNWQQLSAAPKTSDYQIFRTALAEQVIKIRLRNK